MISFNNDSKLFCITSLTHDAEGREIALYDTYTTFYRNTYFSGKLKVFLLINGTSEKLVETVERIDKEFGHSPEKSFDIELIESDINLGCSKGINWINEFGKDYKYVLFLEGDWITLKGSPTWLEESISFMEEREWVDMVYLRTFENSFKVRHHGSQWALTKENTETQETFRKIESPIYTNNPMIRRNASFYDKCILPLTEIENEVHGSEHWGKAEIEAEAKCRNTCIAYYYKFGVFIHFDRPSVFDTKTGEYINRAPMFCPYFEKCKFGFIEDMEPVFCAGCNPYEYEDWDTVDKQYRRYCDVKDSKEQKRKINI